MMKSYCSNFMITAANFSGVCILKIFTVIMIIMCVPSLGGGQYGDVYEAIWKRYNKTVAVKTLKVSCFFFFFTLSF